jgi:hypothetical protein
MKLKFLLIPLLIVLWANQNFAHGQHVHQYIVKEAYELLVTQWGDIIPQMNDHVGGI